MAVRKLKNYIDGKWCDPMGAQYIDVENPSTGEVIAQVPLTSREETNRAIEAAHGAYQSWRNVPVARRTEYLFKLLSFLREDEEKISRILVEEMGKSLPDASAEMKRVFENVEVACGMSVLQQGDKLIGASFEMDGEVIRLPMGVFTMIAPFNFPAMVPFWFLPYAIATGNTFVLKASKQVPCTMNYITELIDRTGLPAGVFNLVNGDKTVADAFMEHPLVIGVSLGIHPHLPGSGEKVCHQWKTVPGYGKCQKSSSGDAGCADPRSDTKYDHLLFWMCRTALYGSFCYSMCGG